MSQVIDYYQPDFYRFNQDTLDLAGHIFSKIDTAAHILDLGAGCGVLGIELARKLRPQSLTLVDCQHDWLSYMYKNSRLFLSKEILVEILIKRFSEIKFEKKFDLIVSNPPYFLPGRGEVSKDPRRHLCRTFVVDNWSFLLDKICESLAPSGRAFIIIKNEPLILREIRAISVPLVMSLYPQGTLVIIKFEDRLR